MILEFEGAGAYRLITDSTIERDVVLSNLLRGTGVQEAMLKAFAAGQEPDTAIFEAVTASGKLFEILGASLVPEGTDQLAWTPEMGRHTADRLRRVASEPAKRLLLLSIVELVKAFFLAGLHSLTTSLSSSQAQGSQAQPDSASAVTTTSAIGA